MARDPLLLVLALLPAGERRAVERGVQRGDFVRVRRGVCVAASSWAALGERERALLRIRAVQAVATEPVIFSHWSAALLLGLPVDVRQAVIAHRTVDPGRAFTQSGVLVHRLVLPALDVLEVDGLLATSIARTAVDLAAGTRFDEAVVVADAALRRLGHGTAEGRERLLETWRAVPGRHGDSKVREAAALSDALAESPAESRSRATMRRLGLPAPVLQRWFHDAEGPVARVDFWFPDEMVVGECDGAVKYLDPALTAAIPPRPSTARSCGRTACVRSARASPAGAGVRRSTRRGSACAWPQPACCRARLGPHGAGVRDRCERTFARSCRRRPREGATAAARALSPASSAAG